MNYYYDKKFCKIYFDEESNSVVLQWIGFAESDQFREACNQSLELLKEKKTKFMIADNTDAKIVSVEDQKWMIDDWFVQAYDAGYRGSAVILAKNVYRELALTNIINHLDKEKFVVKYFEHLSEAKQWIKELQ